jgi:glycosyltransferase involved in cell wall biosynthesis
LSDEVEYVVIDGGSTDGTQDIIAEYAGHLAYWVSERDSGIYDAWNKGLARASGQYIGFVGADDVLLPDALGTYLNHIRQQPDMEYWSSKVAFGHMGGRVIGQPWRWDRFRRYMTVAHVGSLHRRDLYDRFGTYDTSYGIVGDYELLLRVGASLRAGFVDQITVLMGDGGVSNKFALQALVETASAKTKTNATSPAAASFDYYLARFKLAARTWISQKS